MTTTCFSSNIASVSSHSNRLVRITVTGMKQRLAMQTLAVPYSSLSQTMQNIHRSGGKVLDIAVGAIDHGSATTHHQAAAVQPQSATTEQSPANNAGSKKKKK
jgi:CpcD/allophycocyanin linker domain